MTKSCDTIRLLQIYNRKIILRIFLIIKVKSLRFQSYITVSRKYSTNKIKLGGRFTFITIQNVAVTILPFPRLRQILSRPPNRSPSPALAAA